jgi:hypothetical protein
MRRLLDALALPFMLLWALLVYLAGWIDWMCGGKR